MLSAAQTRPIPVQSESDTASSTFDYYPSLGELAQRTVEGIGKVVFQKNVATGLLILAGIFMSSWTAAIGCLFGAGLATLTASLLRSERKILDSGVFGMNGALTGLALFTMTGMGSNLNSLLNLNSWLWAGAGVLFSTVLVSSLSSWLHSKRLPVLAAAYCAATWLCIAALQQFAGLSISVVRGDPNPTGLATQAGSWAAILNGSMNAISSIFMQHGWLPALLILLSIAIQSRVAAVFAAAGAVAGSATALALGAPDTIVQSGLYSCNAAMAAIFLGGILRGDLKHRFSYALSGAILAIVASAAVASILNPFGLPILLFPSVLVGWVALTAGAHFRAFSELLPEENQTDQPYLPSESDRKELQEKNGMASDIEDISQPNEGGAYEYGTRQE
jgi:urea transporter